MSLGSLTELPLSLIFCNSFLADSASLAQVNRHLSSCFSYKHVPVTELQCGVIKAASFGNLEAVKCMLEIPGVDPAFNQSCALRVAAANGNVNVVDHLLPLSDPSAMDNAAYYDALKHGYTEVGQHLLDSGRLVPPKGLLNALIDAAAGGRYENVALLLQFNRIAPVEERVTDYTPLLRAIEISHNDIVELIMNDQVIRVNVFDSGYNPLIYNAINKGNAEALSMLLNSCRIPLDDYEMGKWPRLAAIQPVLAAYQLNRPCGEEG